MTRQQRSIERALDALKKLLSEMEDLEPTCNNYADQAAYSLYSESLRNHRNRVRGLVELQAILESDMGNVE